MTPAADIINALNSRYPPDTDYKLNGWICATEVTGDCGRRADFVAINRFGSRGWRLIGVEVKVSRSDFRRDIAEPEKNKWLTEVCQSVFYAAPKGMLTKAEVPDPWGLITIDGMETRLVKQSRVGHTAEPPLWFWVSFLQAVQRNVLNRGKREIDNKIARAIREYEQDQAEKIHRTNYAIAGLLNGLTC